MANLLRFVLPLIMICVLIPVGVIVGKRLPIDSILQDAQSPSASNTQNNEGRSVQAIISIPDSLARNEENAPDETNAVRSLDADSQVHATYMMEVAKNAPVVPNRNATTDADVGRMSDNKWIDSGGRLRTGVRFFPNAAERSVPADE